LNLLALLGDEQFRVTYDVDEQDVPNLKLQFGSGTHLSKPTNFTKSSCNRVDIAPLQLGEERRFVTHGSVTAGGV
jgi:hypothetical protein